MTEFTEGPWKFVAGKTNHDHEETPQLGGILSEDDWWVAAIEHLGDQGTANAHLIAESPAMYESLEECAGNLAFLANHLEGRIGEGAQAEMFRLAEEAFEILAKASGEDNE